MAEDEIMQEEIAETQTDTEPLIYVGPNILAFALQKYQIFRGGLPPYVVRAIEKIPEIESLIVPVRELESVRMIIRKAGTNEARLFYAIQKESEKFNAEYRKSKRRR